MARDEGMVAPLDDGPYAVDVTMNAMVVMRDDVQLAVDLYRPAGSPDIAARRWPCLLERTPYDKSGTAQSDLVAGHRQPISKPRIA
ncbi:MAG: CocE/NonD family hydrolase, partial [Rhodanobacter sp.]